MPLPPDPRRPGHGWHACYRSLISGERRGVLAGLMRGGLKLASVFYRPAVGFRNFGFDRGWYHSARAAVPVISLGNITTGGTGKTPTAAWVAHWFRERGVRVCFLSRGYGAKAGESNDEALVLELHCPDVPHLQNPNRVESAHIASEELDSQLLILDDGFQHRRLQRDLDVVLLDALNPWGYGSLLPRGLLREPLTALRRADLVVITRVDRATPEQIAKILDRCEAVRGTRDAVQLAFPPQSLVNASGETQPLSTLAGAKVEAFCGIGNPEAFERTLLDVGANLQAFRPLPDHHHFTREDVDKLRTWAEASDADLIVCTEKDLVKLALNQIGPLPLYALRIGAQVITGTELLETHLATILKQIPQ